jgi:hypothetical protein
MSWTNDLEAARALRERAPIGEARGASWGNNSNILRASSRFDGDPTLHFNNVGFRVASIPEPLAQCSSFRCLGADVAEEKRRRVSFFPK